MKLSKIKTNTNKLLFNLKYSDFTVYGKDRSKKINKEINQKQLKSPTMVTLLIDNA